MRYAELVDAIRVNGTALRESVERAEPDIPIEAPARTVGQSVLGLGTWYGSFGWLILGAPYKAEPSSGSWSDRLRRWDHVFETLLAQLDTVELADGEPTKRGVRSFARLLAHETAMCRLDVDSAVKDLPPLMFGTEFAADGIDQYLGSRVGRQRGIRCAWAAYLEDAPEVTGTILYHAADAGRVWQVRLEQGEPSVTTEPTDSGVDADVTVVGTADAVYRSVWGRPSTAVVTGDRSILAAVTSP